VKAYSRLMVGDDGVKMSEVVVLTEDGGYLNRFEKKEGCWARMMNVVVVCLKFFFWMMSV
jgi:hypothetical protein